MSEVKNKKQQIIHDYYCHDSSSDSCDLDCDNCKDEIKKDIDELENLIRADVINNFVTNAITEFQKFDTEHGYPSLRDISEILSDIAEQLKENL